MRTWSIAALVAVLVLATAAGAMAGPRIVNGLFTSEYPSSGALLVGSSSASASLECSGTLIGCETFLTAAHCVCDTIGGECQLGGPAAPDPAGFWVFLQHGGIFAVTSIAVRPDYYFPRGDVAVLHLASPVSGVRPAPIDRTETPSVGTPGTIVGFGSSGGVDYGLKRVGQITSAPCTPPDPVNATLTCWNFEAPVGPPGTDSDTCFGDSGGPLFVDFGCGDSVAGVTSGGSRNICAPTDHSFDADVFTYHAYVDAVGGPDVGMSACGAMPQAGDAGAVITGFTGELGNATPEASEMITVAPGTTRLRVALNAIDDGVADFNLYVRFGAPPTTSVFDCAGVGSGQFAVCDVATPAAGTWYALVRRVTGAGTYQVTATTFAAGSPAPGSDGQACDDHDSCTGSDTCSGGNCFGDVLPNGTPCDDGSGCTQADTCTAGVCDGTATPAGGCRLPVAGGKARVLLKDRSGQKRDQLTWKWRSGTGTVASDYGDPTAATSYELCVFDTHAGVPALVVDAQVPPGSAWTPSRRGFRYRDSSAAVAGMSRIVLKAANGNAAIVAKAKGVGFAVPALPLAADPRVLVQLLNGGACWEARYETSLVNDATAFKAKAE